MEFAYQEICTTNLVKLVNPQNLRIHIDALVQQAHHNASTLTKSCSCITVTHYICCLIGHLSWCCFELPHETDRTFLHTIFLKFLTFF